MTDHGFIGCIFERIIYRERASEREWERESEEREKSEWVSERG